MLRSDLLEMKKEKELGLGQWIAIICFTFLVLNVSAVNADELTHISIQITDDSEISLDSPNRVIIANIEIENFDPVDGYYYMRVIQLSTGEILTESEILPRDITNDLWATKIAHLVDENIENVVGDYEIQIFTEFGTATAKTKFSVVESTNAEVTEWVKNNAKWWSEGQIGDSDFISGIQYLIKEKIIDIPDLPEQASGTAEEKIPGWIKNNAGWWADGQISEDDFVNGIKYLVENGIIKSQLESSSTPVSTIPQPEPEPIPTIPQPEPEPIPTTITVKILSGSHSVGCVKTNSCFSPSDIIIKKGTTVTWTNEDDVTHTVLSGIPEMGPEGIFEDDEILSGETFSYTFELAGIYQYYDVLHPWMVGIVLVKASSDSSVIIPFDVETDKYWYQNGDLIRIWGKALPDENPALSITISVIDPNGIVSAVTQFLPSEDGSFNYNEFRAGETMKEAGEYEIILQYGSQKGSKTIGYLG